MYVTHAPGLNVPELWLGLSTVKVTWEPETRLPQSVIKKIEDGHTIQTAPKTSSCYGLNSTTLVVTTSDSSPSKKPRTETSPTTLKGNTGFVPHPPLHTITICTSSLLSVYSLGSSITCHPVSAAYLLKITRSQIWNVIQRKTNTVFITEQQVLKLPISTRVPSLCTIVYIINRHTCSN